MISRRSYIRQWRPAPTHDGAGRGAAETDPGGSILFLVCALATMWVGGARATLVFGSLGTVLAGALLVAVAFAASNAYVRQGEFTLQPGESATMTGMSSGRMSSGSLYRSLW